MSRWRDQAQAVIREVVAENPGSTGAELRALLNARYPFGERRYYPYRIWCQEVAIACGTRPRPERAPRAPQPRPAPEVHPDQLGMFEEVPRG